MAQDLFEEALKAEGITGQLADLARSVYQQESGAGRNTKTSKSGAVGGMQILPGTFKENADKGWDINDAAQNARAGIRYLKKMYNKADGDPTLAAAGYYGGPGGMAKAKKGEAVSDPKNPNAPNTQEYARQVVSRMPGSILNLPDDQMQGYAAPSEANLAGMFTDPNSPFNLKNNPKRYNDIDNRNAIDWGTGSAPAEVIKDPLMLAALGGESVTPDMSLPPEAVQAMAAQAQIANLGAMQGRAIENPWKAFQKLQGGGIASSLNYGSASSRLRDRTS